MAINDPTPKELLDRPWARCAGAAAVLAGMGGAALLIVSMTLGGASASARPWAIALTAAAAASAIAGVELIRLRAWAQRGLLAFWLIAVVTSAALTLNALLGGAPWWTASLPWYAVLPPVVGLACATVVLLVLASGALGRLRYASMVTVSVAAAVALVFLVNLMAQRDPLRKDIETLGRYGLSDRTQAILKDLDEPVELTCVYTPGLKEPSDEDRRLLESRRDRVVELLQDMHEYNQAVSVKSVASDVDKARLVERLRKQLTSRASAHAAFLSAFLNESKAILPLLREQQQAWAPESAGQYLADWGVPADIADAMKTLADAMAKTAQDVQTRMASLPDYAKLTAEVSDVLKPTAGTLGSVSEMLKQLADLPAAIRAGEKSAMEKVDAATQAVHAMVAAIGKSDGPAPADVAATLKKIAETSAQAAAAMREAAQALQDIAGKDRAKLLTGHTAWQELVPVEGGQLPVSLPKLVSMNAEQIDTNIRQRCEGVLKAANPEYQAQYVQQLRQGTPKFAQAIQDLQARVRQAIDAVATPDEKTAKLFELQKSGKLFEPILQPIAALQQQAEALPKIQANSLPEDVTQDNIVVVETAGKVEVVGFEDVWPARAGAQVWAAGADIEKNRAFDGDSTIGTKILKMTHKSFGTVLMTYVEPSPELARFVPQELLATPEDLQVLRKRLEDANFQVQTWNLAEAMPQEDESKPQTAASAPATSASQPAKEKTQRVLLVLPPPPSLPYGPSSPGMDAQAVAKIKKAVDEGAPAIFLGRFLPSRPELPSAYMDLNDYLGKDWGVEIQSDSRVVPGRADTSQPGQFRADVNRWWYMPLSSFTSHPIGRPLQGHRLLWADLCPVATVRTPGGVKIEPLLQVPEYMKDVWAAKDVSALIQKVRSNEQSLIAPEPQDTLPPFNVAVAATRGAGEGVLPARIVVLAIGASLLDSYLQNPVGLLGPDNTVTTQPPPQADAEAVVNSVYWLLGRQGYIAAGPVQARPVAQLSQDAMTMIQVLFVGALPLLLLAAGGIVMVVRKR